MARGSASRERPEMPELTIVIIGVIVCIVLLVGFALALGNEEEIEP